MGTLTAPVSDIDLFSDDALIDPYPSYARLRDAGPVVRLAKLDVWALPRYEQVRATLCDHQTFSSGSGVGFSEEMNQLLAGFGLLATDPPVHTRLRAVISRMLTPRALRDVGASVVAAADELVTRLVARREFDAVRDLAQVFTVTVVSDLLGLPADDRDQLVDFGAALFDSSGPFGPRTPAAMERNLALLQYVSTTAARERLVEGSMGARIWTAVDAGEIDERAAIGLVTALIAAGMDTTILALSAAVQLFADNPDQWDALRANPGRVPAAFLEVVRYSSPITVATRKTTRACEFDGITIPEGARVGVMYASANRDERKWVDPERFDICRNPLDHMAFGTGVHGCVGQSLSKLEAHAILDALLAKVRRFEVGQPQRIINNTLQGLSELPCQVFA